MSEKPNFLDYVNVYEFECTLPGSKEVVKFKPVTTGMIKRLLTYEKETNYVIQEQALDDLISSSVLSENFNIDEMYIYDKMFLLMELRKKTKGEILEFKIDCPECKSQSINQVNLDELELIELPNMDNHIVELDKGIKVHIRHIKRKHQKQDFNPKYFPKNLTDIQKGYVAQVLYHACAIDKIETPAGMDENIDIKDRMFFIENIPVNHVEMLRKQVDKMEFGWNLEQKIKCPHCGHEETEDIPFQQNFFG